MVELIWEGKVDKDGKRVAPLKVALPFQTICNRVRCDYQFDASAPAI